MTDRMKRNTTILAAVLLAIVLLVFVPILRLDTNVRPECVASRAPCPLAIQTPITGHAVYWSITAYYLGLGAYLVAFTYYGIVL